jgi:glycosyltransferase involved in cell wall biosynthesis
MMISVVMTMYNSREYLKECIESVLTQTYKDFEFIIVDDGSTDDSVSIIKSYNDSRIHLICECHDYIHSLNVAISESKGKFIAHMDSDDIMLKHRLYEQVKYMESHPDIDVLGSGVEYFGKTVINIPVLEKHNEIVASMIVSSPLIHPTVMFRRESLIKVYGENGICHIYEEDFKYAEDVRLWITLSIKKFRFANLNIVLVRYRTSEKQITATRAVEIKNALRIMRAELFDYINNEISFCNDQELKNFYKISCIMYKRKVLRKNDMLRLLSNIYKTILDKK